MNIVGKTLVILNFVFALVTGGFLLIDFQTRKNWKDEYDRVNQEYEVSRANNDAIRKDNTILTDQINKYERMKDDAIAQQQDLKMTQQAKLLEMDLRMKDIMAQASEAKIQLKKASGVVTLLKNENKDLQDVVRKREQTILAMQDSLKDLKREVVDQQRIATTTQARNEVLLERNRKLRIENAKISAGKSTQVASSDPNKNNPPPAYVKGVVERVEKGLVQISLGSDHGLSKNHTLVVYRTSPRPDYLGKVRILETYPHRSVGRLVQSTPKTVRSGDQVASSLSR